MALLRIILIALLIYFILKFIGRLLFSWLYIQNNNNGQFSQNKSKKNNHSEGDVTVQDPGKDKNKVIDKNEGEYIDYEEIK